MASGDFVFFCEGWAPYNPTENCAFSIEELLDEYEARTDAAAIPPESEFTSINQLFAFINMNLIDTPGFDDTEFSLTTFFADINPPEYAILSHTWEAEEVTFEDLQNGTGTKKAGYKKIQFCGEQARRDGLQYFWVDTCCIDKSSSAEAINSMFRCYREATKFYVYLSDVLRTAVSTDDLAWELAFRQSRWFTRGWTLQELIAPTSVEFFSKEGELLGDKSTLERYVCEATGIPAKALRGIPLSDFSIADRMSWAGKRKTTYKEDKAYSLLGIFDISIPVIYGEGRERALKRLREGIDKSDSEIHKDISSWLAQSYTPTEELAGSMYHYGITGSKIVNWRILSSEAGNSDDGHGRTAVHYTPENWHQSLVSFNNKASSFEMQLRCIMNCDRATDPNHEEANFRNDRIRMHLRCPDEDDKDSVSSNDQESLFDYSPSESNTATTVGTSTVQHEVTHTNIEHMLAVLKAERGKCLGELRALDVALENIDQLANRKRP